MIIFGIIIAVIVGILTTIINEDWFKNHRARKRIGIFICTFICIMGITSYFSYELDTKEHERENLTAQNRFNKSVEKLDTIITKIEIVDRMTANSIQVLDSLANKIISINQELSTSIKKQEQTLLNTNRGLSLIDDIAITFDLVFLFEESPYFKEYVSWLTQIIDSSKKFNESKDGILNSYWRTMAQRKANKTDTSSVYDFFLGGVRYGETEFGIKCYYKSIKKGDNEILQHKVKILLPKNCVYSDYEVFAETFKGKTAPRYGSILAVALYTSQQFWVLFNSNNWDKILSADLSFHSGISCPFEIEIDLELNKIYLKFSRVPLEWQVDSGKIVSSIDINKISIIRETNTEVTPLPNHISNITVHYGNNFARSIIFKSEKFERKILKNKYVFDYKN